MLGLYTDGEEWIIAKSHEDAKRIWGDLYSIDDSAHMHAFREMEDDEILIFLDSDESETYPEGASINKVGQHAVEVKATAKQWVDHHAKEMHLCSVNF